VEVRTQMLNDMTAHGHTASIWSVVGEPVARYGPVALNTKAELQQAFDGLERGTFLTDHHRESRVALADGNKA
jgi:muconolactone delta-isomerase